MMGNPDIGIIFNIQRYTIHDGPGIRTELFLKGCPLSCRWCGNPESHRPCIQAGVYSSKCLGRDKCGRCLQCCPKPESLIFRENKLTGLDRALCLNCVKCADACPSDALKQWGKKTTLTEVMDIIRRDISYYENSHGGVTLSGGEPLLQIDFVEKLLTQCRKEHIHTCVETTLCTDWSVIERILPLSDLFISDIKHMDPDIHKHYTGVGNERILENIRRLTGRQKPLILRIPVIPNVNDTSKNMEAAADFICNELQGRIKQLQLLEFMRLGEEKYTSLGIPYPMKDTVTDKDQFSAKVKEFADYFNSRSIPCIVGTTTKGGTKQ